MDELQNVFVGRRLKTISMAVNAVAHGKIDTKISMKGADEISQLSYDFNRMIEGLRSNEYLNREFVKNVSHEFKTPLSIITGYSNLLRFESLTEAERKEYAGYIFQEANRLNNLSGKLLAISRLDANHYNTSFEHFFIDEQIRSVILSM